MTDYDILYFLAIALAVGLIVGFERGWHERAIAEGHRVAGIRTFALIGLSGGLVSVISLSISMALAITIAVGYVGLLIAIRVGGRGGSDVGATTEVASIVTFCLGILAGSGYVVPAIAGSVVSALILEAKPVLHRWLASIDEKEVAAALQLLLISAVVLPLLPDQGYGPYAALNPYRLWLMVALVTGLSFAGYLFVKIKGTDRGVIFMGMSGGLVASTPTSLALLRTAQANSEIRQSIPAAIVAANTVMTARAPLLAVLIYPPLWADLLAPFTVIVLAGVGVTAALWPRDHDTQSHGTVLHTNPLALPAAFGFAAILAVITLLVAVIKSHIGPFGVLGLATLSGFVEVDAITVSLADQASQNMSSEYIAIGLLCAVGANTIVKIVMALLVGPPEVSRRVMWAFATILASGLVALATQTFLKSY